MPGIWQKKKKVEEKKESQTTVEHEVAKDVAAGSCSDLDHGIHCHAPEF